MCEFTWCPFGGNGTSSNTILKENIGEGSHTVTIVENDLPPTTKRFKGSHTDTVLENDLPPTAKMFNYELVVFLGCKPSANSLI